MGWVVGLIIVGACAVFTLSFPSLIRLRDRRRESRHGKREPRSITDGKKKEGACSLVDRIGYDIWEGEAR